VLRSQTPFGHTLWWILIVLAVSTVPAGAQTISGRLLEAGSDRPIEIGVIELVTESGESVAKVLSGTGGRFSISVPSPGSFWMVANAYGYRQARDGIFEVGIDGELTVDFRIVPDPLELEALIVGFNRPVMEHPLVLSGFVDRFAEGFGQFITPFDIERSDARLTPDLFRGMPGITLRSAAPSNANLGGGGVLSYLGDQIMLQGPTGWCTPGLFLDGVRIRYDGDVSIDALLPLSSIDGVEIYRRPSSVPVAFNATRVGVGEDPPCGVILFWTKRR
jgi:Carboxypeptidase regulatory-like domain